MKLINIKPLIGLAMLMLTAVGAASDENKNNLEEVFVSRGEGTITHSEFDARMSVIPEKDRATFLRDPSRLERIAADMLLEKQMAADAKAKGFDQQPNVQARIKLAATAELAKAWLDHYVSLQPEADYEALAKEKYLLNPEAFKTQFTIDVSHILISLDERLPAEAQAIAAEIKQQLDADPSQFEALVAEHSGDVASVARGGRYDGVKKGDMVKNFENKAFSMQPGEISEPVLTQYGYHILRLEALNQPRILPFEEVQGRLIKEQRTAHQRRIRADYVTQLSTLNTEMTEESLRKMLLRYFDEDELKPASVPESE